MTVDTRMSHDEPMFSSSNVNLYDWVCMVILMVFVYPIVQWVLPFSTSFHELNRMQNLGVLYHLSHQVIQGKPAPSRGTRRHPGPTGSHASHSSVSWGVGRRSYTHGDRGSEKQESEGAGIQRFFREVISGGTFEEDFPFLPLLGAKMSHPIHFPRWDMLIPWRVDESKVSRHVFAFLGEILIGDAGKELGSQQWCLTRS